VTPSIITSATTFAASKIYAALQEGIYKVKKPAECFQNSASSEIIRPK
jgi:hypothetical protein